MALACVDGLGAASSLYGHASVDGVGAASTLCEFECGVRVFQSGEAEEVLVRSVISVEPSGNLSARSGLQKKKMKTLSIDGRVFVTGADEKAGALPVEGGAVGLDVPERGHEDRDLAVVVCEPDRAQAPSG